VVIILVALGANFHHGLLVEPGGSGKVMGTYPEHTVDGTARHGTYAQRFDVLNAELALKLGPIFLMEWPAHS
jgi:hypothetical protein